MVQMEGDFAGTLFVTAEVSPASPLQHLLTLLAFYAQHRNSSVRRAIYGVFRSQAPRTVWTRSASIEWILRLLLAAAATETEEQLRTLALEAFIAVIQSLQHFPPCREGLAAQLEQAVAAHSLLQYARLDHVTAFRGESSDLAHWCFFRSPREAEEDVLLAGCAVMQSEWDEVAVAELPRVSGLLLLLCRGSVLAQCLQYCFHVACDLEARAPADAHLAAVAPEPPEP